MITENLSTLKIHRLTQEQYNRELEAGRIDETALYLTPDEEIDLSGYATEEYVDLAISKIPTPDVGGQIDEAITEWIGDKKVGVQISEAISKITHPVTSVNGKTGVVQLSASEVGADASGSASSALSSAKSYTDSEITEWVGDTKVSEQISAAINPLSSEIAKKANASHGNHVPTTETANNTRFLRNDNTWQTVTPANIGALPSSGGTMTGPLTINGTDGGDVPGQGAMFKALSTSTAVAGTTWVGRTMFGAKNLTFLMGTYGGIAGLGAHSWTDAAAGTGAAWAAIHIQPDGGAGAATYIGQNGAGWTANTGTLAVKGSGSINGGSVEVNGTLTTKTQTPSSSLLRNTRLVSSDTNPSVNGEICWTYK